jgi:hypothetical protein
MVVILPLVVLTALTVMLVGDAIEYITKRK